MDGTFEEQRDEFLAHFGVPGMKWGHRKSRIPGVSNKTSREAAKDAKEFTQAKLYFGQGAGVRRRLINNSVNSKSKDPSYKKAFDYHVSNTDLSKRASQARAKRRRTDTVNSTKKTARGIGHVIRGNARYASLSAATIAAGAVYVHSKGYDRLAYNTIKNSPITKRAAGLFSK